MVTQSDLSGANVPLFSNAHLRDNTIFALTAIPGFSRHPVQGTIFNLYSLGNLRSFVETNIASIVLVVSCKKGTAWRVRTTGILPLR